MSASVAREKTNTRAFGRISVTAFVARTSSSLTAGIETSMRSTPASSSILAMRTFSSARKATPGVCSPSRRVTSWNRSRSGSRSPSRASGEKLKELTQ